MSNDLTPDLRETLLETIADIMPSACEIQSDPNAVFLSERIKEAYYDSDAITRNAIDIVVLGITRHKLSALIERNAKINQLNGGVG